MAKTDMERVGLFKEMPYITINDPYRTQKSLELAKPQYKGRQILTEVTKSRSANKDGYFRDFIRIFNGEGYSDPIGTMRRYRIKNAKKNLGKIFIPTSGEKSYSGIGSAYGSFGGIHAYFSGATKARKIMGPEKRNAMTNPAKKGTGYGYADVTINPYPEYKHEPYIAKISNKELKLIEQKIQGRPAFKVDTFGEEYFDKNPYNMDGYKSGFRILKKPEAIAKPFIPSSPTKVDGGMKDGTINKFPYYKSTPYTDKRLPFKVVNVVNSSGKTFIPVPGPQTCPSKSILYTNIDKTINVQNYKGYRSSMAY